MEPQPEITAAIDALELAVTQVRKRIDALPVAGPHRDFQTLHLERAEYLSAIAGLKRLISATE